VYKSALLLLLTLKILCILKLLLNPLTPCP